MQQYGNLFFLLQSEPRHIASLCRLVNLAEIDTLLQTVMFTLYGNQYESREEHLLLSMFQVQRERERERERDTKLCIGDYHTINTSHIRMFWLPNSRPLLNSLHYYVPTHPYHACLPLTHVVVLVNPISNQSYQKGSIKYWKTRMRTCKSIL